MSLGLGYEDTSVSARYGYGYSVSTNYGAFPELTATGGVDFGNNTFAIGPFVSLGYAAYTHASQSLECRSGACSETLSTAGVPDTSGHSWLMIGIRSAYAR